jgi:hypothetical protein
MNSVEFDELKIEYLANIKNYIENQGGLFSHLTIFAKINENFSIEEDLEDDEAPNKPALIHVPIPDEFLSDEDAKQRFIDNVFPVMIKEVKSKFDIYGIAWASEAWLRQAPIGFKVENFKQLPIKQEVVIISLDTEFDNEKCLVYNIERVGKKVNGDGDLIDNVVLTENENSNKTVDGMAGRFCGLYKKSKLL